MSVVVNSTVDTDGSASKPQSADRQAVDVTGVVPAEVSNGAQRRVEATVTFMATIIPPETASHCDGTVLV